MNDTTYNGWTNYATCIEDFSEIMSCALERSLVLQILKTWDEKGLPERFYESGVRFVFNRNSGYVFLVNDDCQVCMMNGSKLDIWHTLPYSGEEGFLDEFDKDAEYHPEDAEYLEHQGLSLAVKS